MVLLMSVVVGTSKRITAFLILLTSQLRKLYEKGLNVFLSNSLFSFFQGSQEKCGVSGVQISLMWLFLGVKNLLKTI